MIGRDDRHKPSTGLANATDTIVTPADLDARRRRRRIRVGRDAALHARRSPRGLERARTEIDHDLVVTSLHAAACHLTVLYRQRRLAGERGLVARGKVGWRRFPAVRLGRHDDAVVHGRSRHSAVEQGGRDQSEGERDNPGAPRSYAQNQAPQSASVCATAQGSTRPVSARRPPSASPTAASRGMAASPYRGRWISAKTAAPTTIATTVPASAANRR